jgi:MFS family permease
VPSGTQYGAPFCLSLCPGIKPGAGGAPYGYHLINLFFGPIADRLGYRLMMLTGMTLLVAGMFAGGLFPFYGVILIALFLAGLGKSIFDPALQAYVSERVPFHRRGLAIGLLEFSWAGSTLLGIPLIAVLIDRQGWRAPFFVMGGLGILGILALRILIEKTGQKKAAGPSLPVFRGAWRQLLRERAGTRSAGSTFLFVLDQCGQR